MNGVEDKGSLLAQQIISYWYDSLTDADLNTIEISKTKHSYVSLDNLQRGQLEPHIVEALFPKKSPKDEGVKKLAEEDEEEENLRVVVAPFIATRGDGRQKHLCPLLIPAELTRDGELLAATDLQRPWIPRTLLEPTTASFALGSIDEFNAFLKEQEPDPDAEPVTGWPAAWQLGHQLLAHMSQGRAHHILQKEGYRIGKNGVVIDVLTVRGAAQHILPVYQQLRLLENLPPLLTGFLNPRTAPPQPILAPEEWLAAAQKHTGSLGNQFAISPTQREALHHFLLLPPHQALAVSGPPGTGKTTLVHSVIASLWVNTAVTQTLPPVIVATSTNNQAVTNVIHSLGGVDAVERWLPVNSFGLYLLNDKKKAEKANKDGLLTTDNRNNGFPQAVQTIQFVEDNSPVYLQKCTAYLQEPISSVAQAVQKLHERLQAQFTLHNHALEATFNVWETWQALNDHERWAQEEADLIAKKIVVEGELAELKGKLETYQEVRTAWRQYQKAEPIIYELLGFLSWFKRRRWNRNYAFLREYLPTVKVNLSAKTIKTHISAELKKLHTAVVERTSDLSRLQTEQQTLVTNQKKRQDAHIAAQAEWEAIFTQLEADLDWTQLFTLEHANGATNETNLFNWLDTNLRYTMFNVATHYWEGRWLLAVTDLIDIIANGRKESRNQETQEQKWRRYAMLTPCFVTTMHSGVSFFTYYQKSQTQYLYNYIDLLIIDEAGQVSPEVSGAMLALAKQALVIGDVQQIEPVWNIPQPVDIGNMRRHKLLREEEEFEEWDAQGITASSGSMMLMAQERAYFSRTSDPLAEQGLLLKEHRRCVPEIIEYCNRLAYHGRLRPMRPTIANHPWPHMGYAHVKGQATVVGGSRQNEREAETLISWLVAQRSRLEAHYGQDLDNIVGIVTPFSAQTNLLRQKLDEHKLRLSKVGTVHALQGGERAVVLFSAVYTTKDGGHYFFDRGPNMLNVAVSRAKDSFILFGDMEIFSPELTTPSGILARYLFREVGQAIADISLPERSDITPDAEITRITTLDLHVRTLARAFERAQTKLLIISPFLRWNAVEADNLSQLVAGAVARGVHVCIYIDRDFNDNLTMPTAKQAASVLVQHGAKLFICRNIHSKALCIDEDIFIEGSFNWLSAVRQKGTDYTRYETSIVYQGAQVKDFVAETVADIEQRVITQFVSETMTT